MPRPPSRTPSGSVPYPRGSSELDADGNGYTVLRDPEGNEFCFVVDEAGRWADTLRRALES